MQTLYILVLCTVAVTYAAETPRPEVTDTALEEALNDKRFIQRQLKCALGEAPCDPIGKRLKTLAPLVLRGACPQCSPQETKQIQRTLSYVQRNYPQQWAKIVRQYSAIVMYDGDIVGLEGGRSYYLSTKDTVHADEVAGKS